jgi:hypothetical protein
VGMHMLPAYCYSVVYISRSRGLRIIMRNADLLSGLRKPVIDCIHLQRYSGTDAVPTRFCRMYTRGVR